jgi:hypothetical protein
MSGFNAFTYNNNTIISSFYDIATINLPPIQTYITNQYNILAPTFNNTTSGYVLETSNNLISIDKDGGFYINNVGIYKISLCFSFFNSNNDEGLITTDVMLNGSNLKNSTDIVSQNNILDVTANGNVLNFNNKINDSISNTLSNEQFSENQFITGTSTPVTGPGNGVPIPYTYYYNMQPSVMYFSTSYQQDQATDNYPHFFFSRYYLSTTVEKYLIPQVSYFNATVNINSTSDKSNYFYPCICPYGYSIWNDGTSNLPQSYLMVQMISNVPF